MLWLYIGKSSPLVFFNGFLLLSGALQLQIRGVQLSEGVGRGHCSPDLFRCNRSLFIVSLNKTNFGRCNRGAMWNS